MATRWSLFCHYFQDGYYAGTDFKYLNEHRRALMKIVRKFGGNDVLYIPDQGEAEDLSIDFYSWTELINEVKRRYNASIIYISEFVRNKRFLPEDTIPDAFYDDFSDLK